MGIPAPTSNLIQPTPKAAAQVATGVVLEVNGDRATVDIAGSPFQVKIPGSVLGVKEGRSVQIRSEGNSRTIVAMTTPIAAPNYSGTPDNIERGSTTPPPSMPSIVDFSWGHFTITTIAQANVELAISSGSSQDAWVMVERLADCLADALQTLEEVRNKVDTMQQDLQDGTGIFK